MKNILLISLLIFSLLPCMATVTGGTGNLSVVSTEHFDIIYGEESSRTAFEIYSCCEEEYADLVSFFDFDPELSVPVVVTDDLKVLNAYYTNSYRNRIVIYDTVGTVGELSNLEKVIPDIFLHELTHAFTMNIRSPFWQIMADIFGDAVSVSPVLYQYLSLVEGAAVYSESREGYGRLNDPSVLTSLRQAKLEEVFPNFIEISGARSVYPTGTLYYHFGGAFISFLSDEFGSEKVAQLYIRMGKINWFKDTEAIMKDVFGVPVKELWADFEESISIPESVMQPEFLDDEYGSYDCLIYRDGVVYGYDKSSWSLFRLENSSESESGSERESIIMDEILVYTSSEPAFDISDEGLFLLGEASQSVVRTKLVKDNDSVYGKTLRYYEDARCGCFVRCDGELSVLLYCNEGQDSYLEICGPEVEQDGCEKVYLGHGVAVSDFVGIGGKAFFLLTDSGRDYIGVFDCSDRSVKTIDLGVHLRSLSSGKDEEGPDVLCFSWIPYDENCTNMMRYGEFIPEKMQYRLSEADFSGGVYNPVRVGSRVYFASHMFEGHRLSSSDMSEQRLSDFMDCEACDFSAEADLPDLSEMAGLSVKYKPLSFMKRGVVIPIAITSDDVGLGVTFITQDPTETKTLMASSGYGLDGPIMYFSFSDNGLIPFSAALQAKYYTGDNPYYGYFRGFVFKAGLSSELSTTLRSSGETLSASMYLGAGIAFPEDSDFYYSISDSFLFSYSNLRYTGMSRTDYRGYAFSFSFSHASAGASASYHFDRLLPIGSKGRFTFNLPAQITAKASYDFQYDRISLEAVAKCNFLDIEFRKGLYFMNLYLQYFTLDGSYDFYWIPEAEYYLHSFDLSALFYFTPVIGEYLTQMKFGAGATLSYYIGGNVTVTFAGSISI